MMATKTVGVDKARVAALVQFIEEQFPMLCRFDNSEVQLLGRDWGRRQSNSFVVEAGAPISKSFAGLLPLEKQAEWLVFIEVNTELNYPKPANRLCSRLTAFNSFDEYIIGLLARTLFELGYRQHEKDVDPVEREMFELRVVLAYRAQRADERLRNLK